MRRNPIPVAVLLLGGALACQGEPRDARPPAASSPASAASPAGDRTPPRGVGAAPGATGPRAEGEFWAVALEAPGFLRAGQPSEARLRVTARGGYHVNEEYPMSFRPADGATAALVGERVTLAARGRGPCGAGVEGACDVTAALPFVPEAPGQVRLAGTLAFSVCTAERCLIEKVPLAISAAVR